MIMDEGSGVHFPAGPTAYFLLQEMSRTVLEFVYLGFLIGLKWPRRKATHGHIIYRKK